MLEVAANRVSRGKPRGKDRGEQHDCDQQHSQLEEPVALQFENQCGNGGVLVGVPSTWYRVPGTEDRVLMADGYSANRFSASDRLATLPRTPPIRQAREL
jgi:hypothetical protein